MGHGADFPAQAHFSCKAVVGRYGEVDIGRKYGGNHSQVAGSFGNLEPSGHIQKDILYAQLEPGPLFQYGQEHIQAAGVVAGCGTLGCAIDCGTHKCLDLNEKWTRTIQMGPYGDAAQIVRVHRHPQFRRVGHLHESGPCHLEDCDLRCGPETVLDSPQQPVRSPVIALELQHNVHDVFQNLRTGYAAFLGDVAYENDRDACVLGKFEQLDCRFFDLGHGTRRRFYVLGIHRLH